MTTKVYSPNSPEKPFNGIKNSTSNMETGVTLSNSIVDNKNPTKKEVDTSLNNGGTTSYYDLPFPPSKENPRPTLNDIIEHKNMSFWRGDAFKALYALEERAVKIAKSPSKADFYRGCIRELNKSLYYISRGLRLYTDLLSLEEEKAKAKTKTKTKNEEENPIPSSSPSSSPSPSPLSDLLNLLNSIPISDLHNLIEENPSYFNRILSLLKKE